MGNQEQVERIYIREAADLLKRRMATMRKWEQLGILPKHLLPHRGKRGWRYWTPEQIDGIRDWLRETDRRPGKGLPHYNPTEQQLDMAIAAMRRPRRRNGAAPSTSSGVPEDLVPKKKPKPSGRKRPGT
jgi:hypothetical protein